jgi:L-seryl-tRNA(Ser) seleniumtransferase
MSSKKPETKDIGARNGASKLSRLRTLPSVDRVLSHAALAQVLGSLPHELVTQAVRAELDSIREVLLRDGGNAPTPTDSAVATRAAERAWGMVAPSLKSVINATGVVIHTNLGRAPLSRAAMQAISQASEYGNLEFDLETGTRGSRYVHAVDILRRVTGCESALVVNNNAAALVLVLAVLGTEKEVIVSRGQLVEIGGGFRIPEIMRQSGARLVEVGTTNRTYITDYARAITGETALLMRIHASNFRILGFTASPSIAELATLAHQHGLFMVDDVGSGALLDTTSYGLTAEPTVRASLQAGADLVMFSGDKLLGGPQCGIIVGRREIVELLTKHPLARALRVDKLTLAALEATLLHYLKGEAEQEIPVWRMIAASEQSLKATAERWQARLANEGVACQAVPGESAIGGGSLPAETLPTWLLSITSSEDAGQLARALREAQTPIVARVEHGTLLLDPRTVLEGHEETLLAEVVRCVKRDA